VRGVPSGRFATVIALAWGWAEAMCFFIVPDVWLSLT